MKHLTAVSKGVMRQPSSADMFKSKGMQEMIQERKHLNNFTWSLFDLWFPGTLEQDSRAMNPAGDRTNSQGRICHAKANGFYLHI